MSWMTRALASAVEAFVTRERAAARAEALRDAMAACAEIEERNGYAWEVAGECEDAIRALGRDETKETK